MKNKLNIVIFIGFVLVIAGGFMETQALEPGKFISGFGSGMVAAGVLQLIYNLIWKRKARQTT